MNKIEKVAEVTLYVAAVGGWVTIFFIWAVANS